MIRFLCRIGFHRWSRWRNIRVRVTSDIFPAYTTSGQVKECVLCKREKVKI